MEVKERVWWTWGGYTPMSRLMLKHHVKYVAYIENGVLSIHLAILILFSSEKDLKKALLLHWQSKGRFSNDLAHGCPNWDIRKWSFPKIPTVQKIKPPLGCLRTLALGRSHRPIIDSYWYEQRPGWQLCAYRREWGWAPREVACCKLGALFAAVIPNGTNS